MNPPGSTPGTLLAPGLRSALLGLGLAILTILYGQGMGVFFGLNEEAIQNQLKTSAAAVRLTAYNGDDAAIKVVLGNAWNFIRRAHLHAGGMGTTAFALMLVVGFLNPPRLAAWLIGIGLGAGGLGYSAFWMWAGLRAPGLGGTKAAKESLRWLAMSSSGAFVVATLAVLVLLIIAMVSRPRKDSPKN
ncbi:MAG: hypothetical protein JSR48_05690 [Verrucomicrobia bacterium]|nr:hypothetical protein [Verrucomicrobiota bacterium]